MQFFYEDLSQDLSARLHFDLASAQQMSLYTFVYKCIRPGIIHRAKIKSKYIAAQQSHYQIKYKIQVPT